MGSELSLDIVQAWAVEMVKNAMTSKNDGLWHAEDYDDEPRSHGNFGIDPCMRMMEAEAAARKRAEFKHELDLAYEFMRERHELCKSGGKHEPQTR